MKTKPVKLKPKLKRGRKPFGTMPMTRRNVTLDERTVNRALLIGEGNLSAGIRKAVEAWVSRWG